MFCAGRVYDTEVAGGLRLEPAALLFASTFFFTVSFPLFPRFPLRVFLFPIWVLGYCLITSLRLACGIVKKNIVFPLRGP